MFALPSKRLLVYVAAGLVVVVVGTIGLVAAGRGAGETGAVVVQTDSAGAGGLPGDGWASDVAAAAATTTTVPRIWVQVAGAVHVPGVYQLAGESRVFEAVAAAGGFTEEADQQAVALAAVLTDGCRVYVPKVGETMTGAVVGPADSSAGVTGGSTGSGSAGGLVSLNRGTAAELDSLPGIGPSLAQQIISYRESQGPFTSIDQLTDVPGIGPSKMEQLRSLVAL
jgi:competence protein ComEA